MGRFVKFGRHKVVDNIQIGLYIKTINQSEGYDIRNGDGVAYFYLFLFLTC